MSQLIDLTACEHEPITIPGSIQPHGLLLVLRGIDLIVVQVSANLPAFFDVAPVEMLGRPVSQWFDEASVRALVEAAEEDDPPNPLLLARRVASDDRYDGILHRCGSELILELARVQPGVIGTSVRGALSKLQGASTEAEACWMAAKEIHRLTGFDRVMVYRFAADWSGEVIAEARKEGVDSYLGTHFPASDIPKQARELYTRKLLGLDSRCRLFTGAVTRLGGGATPGDEPVRAAQHIANSPPIPPKYGRHGHAYRLAGHRG